MSDSPAALIKIPCTFCCVFQLHSVYHTPSELERKISAESLFDFSDFLLYYKENTANNS